ncbi:MAG: HAD family hydrolase [Candidatus Lokiarchaeota archaeon]|nr:HAD family hydrolase [Candidatus Lokiarchaeota archaeon]
MQGKNSIKAIIWDLDGTLIYFNIDFVRARREAIKILKKNGVPKPYLSVEFSILDNVAKAREFFTTQGLSEQKVAKIIKEVDTIITKVEYEAAQKAQMVHGIDQVLEYAKAKKLKQAIFTFNTNNNAEISLKTVNLRHFFKIIVGRDNVNNLKPHPEHLIYICNQLKVTPGEVLVIGDSSRDIEAAINVGAYSIALDTKKPNFFGGEFINKADVIIEHNEIPSKIIEAIEKLL